MCQVWMILLFLFFAPTAKSGELKWLKAESHSALKKIIKKQERLEELKALCLRQLSKKQIPHYCYEWLLQSRPKNKEQIIRYLDENCLKFPLLMLNLKSAKEALKGKGLSQICRKKILQEKKKWEYRLRDAPPSQYLKQHALF